MAVDADIVEPEVGCPVCAGTRRVIVAVEPMVAHRLVIEQLVGPVGGKAVDVDPIQAVVRDDIAQDYGGLQGARGVLVLLYYNAILGEAADRVVLHIDVRVDIPLGIKSTAEGDAIEDGGRRSREGILGDYQILITLADAHRAVTVPSNVPEGPVGAEV